MKPYQLFVLFCIQKLQYSLTKTLKINKNDTDTIETDIFRVSNFWLSKFNHETLFRTMDWRQTTQLSRNPFVCFIHFSILMCLRKNVHLEKYKQLFICKRQVACKKLFFFRKSCYINGRYKFLLILVHELDHKRFLQMFELETHSTLDQ